MYIMSFKRSLNMLKQINIDEINIGSIQIVDDEITGADKIVINSENNTSGLYINDNNATNIFHIYKDTDNEYYLDMNCVSATKHLNLRRFNGVSWVNIGHIEFTSTPHINFVSGGYFSIAGNNVLNQTTLGSSVVNSSLTSVGTLSNLTVAGDVTIDSTTLKVDSTNNRVGIMQASPSQTLHVAGTIQTDTGLITESYINANTREFLKCDTNRPGIYFRTGRIGTGLSSTTNLCLNVNRDSGTLSKDNSSYGSCLMQLNEDSSMIFQQSVGSLPLNLSTSFGCNTQQEFYLTNGGTINFYPIIFNSAQYYHQSGRYTGGSATGTITFSQTYVTAPNVVATIESTNSTNLYSIVVHTVTTTNFQFRKKYQNGSTTVDAITENFYWMAIGLI